MLRLIKIENIFGRFRGDVYTIEYQKRGLPHMYLLIFLNSADAFFEASHIDEVICAELPTVESDPTGELTRIVTSVMLHGPCGEINSHSPCMSNARDGPPRCTKNYPCNFLEETSIQENGYPLYRRRNNGSTHEILHPQDRNRKFTMDRYIGLTEAMWRIFEFSTHEEFPPVEQLAIHLPGEQPVYYEEDVVAEELQERMDSAQSTLMAFFEYNNTNEESRRYLYQEFPEHYVYLRKERRWKPRQRGFAIGRMYHCNPFAGARYYLRLLLTVVRGAKSFQDLRTVNGILHYTFQATCVARGLLEDDREWLECFGEASLFASGKSLHVLFATSLIHGGLTDAIAIWDKFATHFCDDLPYQLQNWPNIPEELTNPHHDYGLYLLGELLKESGKSLEECGFPLPTHIWRADNSLLRKELNYDPWEEALLEAEKLATLNLEQRQCFDNIISAVDFSTGEETRPFFFIQGPAGTGKTFLYSVLCHHYRAHEKIVLCVAFSGIASLLLPEGRTSHFRLRIPINLHESSQCNISKNSELGDLLRQVTLLIWDEVPMQHRFCFEAVDRMPQDIKSNNRLFRGLLVIMGGDFAQILPIVCRGTRATIVGACIQRSYIWPRLSLLFLRQNIRLLHDPNSQEFATWLQELSYNSQWHSRISLPPFL